MKRIFVFLFKTLFKLITHFRYQHFLKTFNDPKSYQQKLKIKLLQNLKDQNFSKFEDLPIIEYQDIASKVDKGLTQDSVIFNEYTSGSSGQNKKIPYTKSLLSSFTHMFLFTSVSILKHISLKKLKFYFSIGPQFGNEGGLESDKDYLGPYLKYLLSPFFLEIPGAKKIRDQNEFHQKLYDTFKKNPDLEIISIWSPSFLISLGSFCIEKKYISKLQELPLLFPGLKFISAWGDGHAKEDFHRLENIFPNVVIQKKGLLATEAPMSLPLYEAKGQVPLLEEVYYEFRDDLGKIHTIEEIQIGKEYEIIISQKSGLTRYQTNDIIRTTHYFKQTPCFEFCYRKGAISDLVGEKLHISLVRKALAPHPESFLIPCKKEHRYYLFFSYHIDKGAIEQIEKILLQNVHYHNALNLGQLKTLSIHIRQNVSHKILYYFQQKGISPGDLKMDCFLYKEWDGNLISFLLKQDT